MNHLIITQNMKWDTLISTLKKYSQITNKEPKQFIMNRQLWLITFCMVVLTTVNAQDGRDFEFGGNIGLNLASVSTADGLNNVKTRMGLNVGASAEYYFSDDWGLKMKLIYDGKGWADGFIESEDIGNVTTNFKLDYITIPLMANWHLGRNRNLYLNFGPYAGLLTSAIDSALGIDVKEAFKSIDFGIAFGIGYKINLSDTTKLFFEWDNQSGLTDIFEENLGDTVKNGRSSLNFGVLFGL